jgi:replication factor C subunit 3/5
MSEVSDAMQTDTPAKDDAMEVVEGEPSRKKTKGESAKEAKKGEQNLALPWVEKYRPKSLDELISHDDIITTCKSYSSTFSFSPSLPNSPSVNRLIDGNKLPHLLFYGPAGTGKTSTILAAARRLYGDKYQGMTLEVWLLVFTANAPPNCHLLYLAQRFRRAWYRCSEEPDQRIRRHQKAFQVS